MSAEFEVQKALYLAISGLGITTYDVGPQAADGGNAGVFPYAEVGDIVAAPFDTARETGFDLAARLHVRSRSGSKQEARDMLGAIYARLHRGTLVVTGYLTIDVLWQMSDVLREADGAFHGVAEYRITLTL